MERVLLIDRDRLQRDHLEEQLCEAGHEVTARAGWKNEGDYTLVIAALETVNTTTLKRWMAARPDLRFVALSDSPTVSEAVELLRAGAFHYLPRPLTDLETLLSRKMEQVAHEPSFIGLNSLKPLIARVAPTNATILLTGETGTGKEVVASAIQSLSGRKGGPFVKVNCAAIPETLVESAFFGHEKGAFTSASARHLGHFERASGGTLLLDEISAFPPHLQPKLLRVLQEGEVERVGGKQTIPVDVRIIATSNEDLEALVEEGHFRADLYYRLSVIRLDLPPLRMREEDLLPLACHFAQQLGGKLRNELQLSGYNWPGNVRELRNAMERDLILGEGNFFQVDG